jgi:hypothetical protein
MKLPKLAIAAAVAAGALVATPVVAQTHVEVNRTVTTTKTVNGGWHPKWRRHKVCRTHWYHHRKVTRCTWRRYRI